jgi:hypothetical protein
MSIIQDALKKVNSNPVINTPAPKEKKRISRIFIFAPIAVIVIIAAAFLALNSQLLARSAQAVPRTNDALPSQPSSRQEVIKKGATVKQNNDPRSALKPKIAQPPKYQLNGIMYIESGPKAIVNGSVVKEGDLINGATVKKIARQEVLLSYEDVDILLNMND